MFIFIAVGMQLYGQINIKIGYSFSAINPVSNNQLLQDFNDLKVSENVDVVIPYSDLRMMHGIHLGLRYLFKDTGGFEISYEGLGRNRRIIGENGSDGSLFDEELFYSIQQVMVGYQSIFGNYGLGTSIGYSNLKIKQEIGNSEFKSQILGQSQFNARVNLAYYLKSNNTVSIALQPYIQFPLSSYRLDPLADELGLTGNPRIEDSFFSYGLTIVFYNGRQ